MYTKERLFYYNLFFWNKNIVHTLTSIDSSIYSDDHIATILDRLFENYDNFVTSITSKLDLYTMEEIETLLSTQEEPLRNTKHLSKFFFKPILFLDHGPKQLAK